MNPRHHTSTTDKGYTDCGRSTEDMSTVSDTTRHWGRVTCTECLLHKPEPAEELPRLVQEEADREAEAPRKPTWPAPNPIDREHARNLAVNTLAQLVAFQDDTSREPHTNIDLLWRDARVILQKLGLGPVGGVALPEQFMFTRPDQLAVMVFVPTVAADMHTLFMTSATSLAGIDMPELDRRTALGALQLAYQQLSEHPTPKGDDKPEDPREAQR